MSKATKYVVKVVAVVTLLVTSAPLLTFASPMDLGNMISATPFDGKVASAGIFSMYFPSGAVTKGVDASYSYFMRAKSFRYSSDTRGDSWQSADETERRGSGDCEDKAVWLYTQLVQNGYGNAARLVIGKYRQTDRRYHVWVQVTDDSGSVYILDPTTQKRVWRASDFGTDFFIPLYSYDTEHRYKH